MKHELAVLPIPVAIGPRTKGVIYCRVSSPHQLKRGDGLSSQEAVCRQYAERMGYDVLEVFRDNVTGGITDRPAMHALMKYLREHRSEGFIVIIDDVNRFARDVRGHWDLRDLLRAAGGRLASPKMTFGDSPAERLVENLIVSTAQYQREQNAEQTKDRQKGRLLNGFWPFIPPRAMRHQRVPGIGNVLVRVEPEASVIAEGLEAFACGRLRSQAEFARWLNAHPDFGKGHRTHVTNQQAHDLLTKFLYGGVVEKPDWGVSRRKGRHEGLVSYETFERIQQRLSGASYASARSDVSADFPLRGSVSCAHCGKPLTACWSRSKTGAEHPYYMCFARGCPRYRKSIRRERIESAFVEVLDALTPQPKLLTVARAMFESAWNQRAVQADAIAKSFDRQIGDVDKKIAGLLDRIVDATSATVIGAFEKRIGELERTKLVLQEKRDKTGEVRGAFEEMFELAFDFLANPAKLWRLGRLDYRKLVLRLAFPEPLAYAPDGGFRTPKTAMPFRMLSDIRGVKSKMAERMSAVLAISSVRRHPEVSTKRPESRAFLSIAIRSRPLQSASPVRVGIGIGRRQERWHGN